MLHSATCYILRMQFHVLMPFCGFFIFRSYILSCVYDYRASCFYASHVQRCKNTYQTKNLFKMVQTIRIVMKTAVLRYEPSVHNFLRIFSASLVMTSEITTYSTTLIISRIAHSSGSCCYCLSIRMMIPSYCGISMPPLFKKS